MIPSFHLCVAQIESSGELHAILHAQVLLSLEALLQAVELVVGEGGASLARLLATATATATLARRVGVLVLIVVAVLVVLVDILLLFVTAAHHIAVVRQRRALSLGALFVSVRLVVVVVVVVVVAIVNVLIVNVVIVVALVLRRLAAALASIRQLLLLLMMMRMILHTRGRSGCCRCRRCCCCCSCSKQLVAIGVRHHQVAHFEHLGTVVSAVVQHERHHLLICAHLVDRHDASMVCGGDIGRRRQRCQLSCQGRVERAECHEGRLW